MYQSAPIERRNSSESSKRVWSVCLLARGQESFEYVLYEFRGGLNAGLGCKYK